jgi:hypothetical protein
MIPITTVCTVPLNATHNYLCTSKVHPHLFCIIFYLYFVQYFLNVNFFTVKYTNFKSKSKNNWAWKSIIEYYGGKIEAWKQLLRPML